jgi:hypothetical protein
MKRPFSKESGRRVCDAFATRLRRVSGFTCFGWGRQGSATSFREGAKPLREFALFFIKRYIDIWKSQLQFAQMAPDPDKYEGCTIAVWLIIQPARLSHGTMILSGWHLLSYIGSHMSLLACLGVLNGVCVCVSSTSSKWLGYCVGL